MKITLQILTWLAVAALCVTLNYWAMMGLLALVNPPENWAWLVKLLFLGFTGCFFIWLLIVGGGFLSVMTGAWYESRYHLRMRQKRIKQMLKDAENRK
jgi:hypothetical protein